MVLLITEPTLKYLCVGMYIICVWYPLRLDMRVISSLAGATGSGEPPYMNTVTRDCYLHHKVGIFILVRYALLNSWGYSAKGSGQGGHLHHCRLGHPTSIAD